MMPFRKIVQKNLDKIKDLDIRLIAPSHGPIHRDPATIIQAYRDWTDDMPHNSVVIPWVTMHGSTEIDGRAPDRRAGRRGASASFPSTWPSADIGQLAMALVDAATLVVAPRPSTSAPPDGLQRRRPGQRPPAQGPFRLDHRELRLGREDGRRSSRRRMPNLKVEMLPSVIAKGLPKPADLEAIDALAEAIAAKHKALGLRLRVRSIGTRL